MRVRSINSENDWTFGKGRANYLTGSSGIAQNVKTRLRSFRNDWFLDMGAGIDWLTLLGNPGTERRILRAVERAILQTEGVVRLTKLQIVGRDSNRGVRIEARYFDVFGVEQNETLEQTP